MLFARDATCVSLASLYVRIQAGSSVLADAQSPCSGDGEESPIVIGESALPDYVGKPPFARDRIYEETPAGVVMGLAWSSQGGNSLYIEAASVERADGKGSLKSTGKVPTSYPVS